METLLHLIPFFIAGAICGFIGIGIYVAANFWRRH